MQRIPADVKNSEKFQTYANRIFKEGKEYQNIHVFAFLLRLQAYLNLGILNSDIPVSIFC